MGGGGTGSSDGRDSDPVSTGTDGVERLMGHFNGYFAVAMLGLGHRSGLLAALLQGGGTAAELSRRAGTHQRSTEEWLAAVTAAGYLKHDQGVFTFVEGQDLVFRPGLLPFDVTVLLELAGQVRQCPGCGRRVPSQRSGRAVRRLPARVL